MSNQTILRRLGSTTPSSAGAPGLTKGQCGRCNKVCLTAATYPGPVPSTSPSAFHHHPGITTSHGKSLARMRDLPVGSVQVSASYWWNWHHLFG